MAIVCLCTAIAESNICGAVGEAHAMSVPGLPEVCMWLLASHHASYAGQKGPRQFVHAGAAWSLPSNCLWAMGGLSLCQHRS